MLGSNEAGGLAVVYRAGGKDKELPAAVMMATHESGLISVMDGTGGPDRVVIDEKEVVVGGAKLTTVLKVGGVVTTPPPKIETGLRGGRHECCFRFHCSRGIAIVIRLTNSLAVQLGSSMSRSVV